MAMRPTPRIVWDACPQQQPLLFLVDFLAFFFFGFSTGLASSFGASVAGASVFGASSSAAAAAGDWSEGATYFAAAARASSAEVYTDWCGAYAIMDGTEWRTGACATYFAA